MFSVVETIDAPPETVWRYFEDPELMGSWMPGVELVRSIDGKPLRKGSRLHFAARGAARTGEIAEFDPLRAITIRSTQGPFTATYHYSIGRGPTPTQVTLDAVCAARGPAAFIAPLVRVMIKRADSGQLKVLKATVEADEQAKQSD